MARTHVRLHPVLLLAAAAAVSITACSSASTSHSPAATGTASSPAGGLTGTITLGAVLPLTGVNATVGKDQQRGIQLAVADINAAGGVLGKKLVVDIEDSQGTAPAAIQAAQKLVSVTKVPVVIGEFSSGNTIPMQQYLQKQHIVGLNPGSSSIAIRGIGSYEFSTIGLDDVAGKFTASALTNKGFKNIAILAPNNAFGSGIAKSVSDSFTQMGGTVKVSDLYTEGQADYRSELGRLQSSNPDVYVVTTYGKDGATINNEMYQLGMTKKPVFDIYLSDDVPDSNKTAVEGRIGMDVNSIANTPAAAAYRAEYKKAYGENFITSYSGYTYDAVKMAALAIAKAGSADPTAIQAALPAISQTYNGVTGPIVFDKDNQRTTQPYILATVKNGQIIPNGG